GFERDSHISRIAVIPVGPSHLIVWRDLDSTGLFVCDGDRLARNRIEAIASERAGIVIKLFRPQDYRADGSRSSGKSKVRSLSLLLSKKWLEGFLGKVDQLGLSDSLKARIFFCRVSQGNAHL